MPSAGGTVLAAGGLGVLRRIPGAALPGVEAEGVLPDVHPRTPAAASEKRTEAGWVDEREGIGEVSASGGSAVRLCTLGAQSSHNDEGAVPKGSREGIDRAGE